ncbi:MAG: FHA domain-containing protein [Magnetococcales bacterium]|nr:FHA domain-containing protein [Magnetococcales bacterium]
MPKTVLESLSNMFGRVKRSELRIYAEQVGRTAFLEFVSHPCLVGTGRFAGEFIEKAKDNNAITMEFKLASSQDAIREENAATGVHESIYPLIVPVDHLTGSKRFRIGRSNNNDIVIPDYAISGEHAHITYEKRAYWLEDLLSTNGTAVNDTPMMQGQKVALKDGDCIKLGRFQFLVAWPAALYALLTQPTPPKQAVESSPPVLLGDLTDAMGRFDFMYLKQYCRHHSRQEFAKLVVYPVFVGAAFFPGAVWQREEGSVDTSRSLSLQAQGGRVRSLAGSMFPLIRNPNSAQSAGTFVIGRSAAVDLRMNDLTISKQHARIEVKEGKIFLSDTGSSNGTSVNAVALRPFVPKEIVAGDRIGFGKNYFIFLPPERLHINMQESEQ